LSFWGESEWRALKDLRGREKRVFCIDAYLVFLGLLRTKAWREMKKVNLRGGSSNSLQGRSSIPIIGRIMVLGPCLGA
jgi:hypothetical protein